MNLDDAMAWLADQQKANDGHTVTVRRDAQTIQVQAVLGHSLLNVSDGHGGNRVVRTDRDYLILAADYDFGSGPVEPADGDEFDETTKTPTGTYAAYPPGPLERCFRYSDADGYMLRIHTKRVSENTGGA